MNKIIKTLYALMELPKGHLITIGCLFVLGIGIGIVISNYADSQMVGGLLTPRSNRGVLSPVGPYASTSQDFDMERSASASMTLDSSSSTQGACIKLKEADGSGYTYIRALNGSLTVNTTPCK